MPLSLKSLLALILAGSSWVTSAAEQTATTTSAVNVRAGPENIFPTVTSLLSGTQVTVVGCTANWRWCDVIAGRDRGWVYTRFLSVPFNGSAVTIINGGPNLGLPQSEFSLGEYWDAHYQRQQWFGRKAYWQNRWDRRAPPREWRDPSLRRTSSTGFTPEGIGSRTGQRIGWLNGHRRLDQGGSEQGFALLSGRAAHTRLNRSEWTA
jgi:uncharacterized protein YraI